MIGGNSNNTQTHKHNCNSMCLQPPYTRDSQETMHASALLFLFVRLLSFSHILLMQTKHFILLLQIKRVQKANHRVYFIVKQPQVTQCIYHQDLWYYCTLKLVYTTRYAQFHHFLQCCREVIEQEANK